MNAGEQRSSYGSLYLCDSLIEAVAAILYSPHSYVSFDTRIARFSWISFYFITVASSSVRAGGGLQ